jgi:uncharacterized protein (TIGR00255 family)
MIKSMTGFGRGECTRDSRRFKVEIKSVNHRFSDFTVKLPRFLNPFEDRIRARLAQTIVRGKVDVWISFESYTQDDVTISVNEVFADAYMKALDKLAERYTGGELPPASALDILSRTPDVIVLDRYESALSGEKAQDAMWSVLSSSLEDALTNYDNMRKTEGDALAADVREKHTQVCALLVKIKSASGEAVEASAERLRLRLADLIAKIGQQRPDDGRILTEIAILADKNDINEEITRLDSHMKQLGVMLKEKDAVGRKMDFLVQEMNREANTIGSKSADVQLTQLVVELKSLIEKIREQVQNIE